MKRIFAVVLITFLSLPVFTMGAEVPTVLAEYFEEDKPVRAEIFTVVPPKEFGKLVQKLSEVAQKDPAWYAEHSKKTPAGTPIPIFDEKLGMTKEEYDKYVALWDAREVKKLADVALLLQASSDGQWQINGSGVASSLTLLRFQPQQDAFKSPNGLLARIADIDAPERSLLGAWQGKEWRYLSENSLSTTKENIALGKSKDGKYGMMIYRLQEVTSSGRPLYDKSMFIRFALKKS